MIFSSVELLNYRISYTCCLFPIFKEINIDIIISNNSKY